MFTCSTPSSGDANVTPGIEMSFAILVRAERRDGGEGRVLHAWQRLKPLQHLAVSLAQALILEAGPVCVDRHHQHAVGHEPQRLRLQIAQAHRKECGRHDQHRRQRDLYRR